MTLNEFKQRHPEAYAFVCDPEKFNFTLPEDYPDCGYVTQDEVLEGEFVFDYYDESDIDPSLRACPDGTLTVCDVDCTWWGWWDGTEFVDG